MLINKQNIKDLVQFTLNIENRIIDPNINDAQEYDLRPIIGDDMYNQIILDFDDGAITVWDTLEVYTIGQFVSYDGLVYKALTGNTGSQPDLNPLDWQVNELGTFFIKYLQPYLVFASFKRFLLWVGRNITQYGLREMNEDTSVPVTDEGRAALIGDIKVKAKTWYNRFNNYLCQSDVDWTFDMIKYEVDCDVYKENPKKFFKIRPVNGYHKEKVYKKNNQGWL